MASLTAVRDDNSTAATRLANGIFGGDFGPVTVSLVALELMFEQNNRELWEFLLGVVLTQLNAAERGMLAEMGPGTDDKAPRSLNEAGLRELFTPHGSGRQLNAVLAALSLALHMHDLLSGEVPGLSTRVAKSIALRAAHTEAFGEVTDQTALERLLKQATDDPQGFVLMLQAMVRDGRLADVAPRTAPPPQGG